MPRISERTITRTVGVVPGRGGRDVEVSFSPYLDKDALRKARDTVGREVFQGLPGRARLELTKRIAEFMYFQRAAEGLRVHKNGSNAPLRRLKKKIGQIAKAVDEARKVHTKIVASGNTPVSDLLEHEFQIDAQLQRIAGIVVKLRIPSVIEAESEWATRGPGETPMTTITREFLNFFIGCGFNKSDASLRVRRIDVAVRGIVLAGNDQNGTRRRSSAILKRVRRSNRR